MTTYPASKANALYHARDLNLHAYTSLGLMTKARLFWILVGYRRTQAIRRTPLLDEKGFQRPAACIKNAPHLRKNIFPPHYRLHEIIALFASMSISLLFLSSKNRVETKGGTKPALKPDRAMYFRHSWPWVYFPHGQQEVWFYASGGSAFSVYSMCLFGGRGLTQTNTVRPPFVWAKNRYLSTTLNSWATDHFGWFRSFWIMLITTMTWIHDEQK